MSNWIKMRVDLADDPSVVQMAATLGVDEDLIVGKLHRLWGWADRQTTDGKAVGITAAWIDRYVYLPGFADAMAAAGWLRITESGITIPNFDRHNGESAKRRTEAAERQRLSRQKRSAVTEVSQKKCDTVTKKCDQIREEKIREEDLPSVGLSSESEREPGMGAAERFLADRAIRTGATPPGFAEFIAQYPAGRATNRVETLEQWKASVGPSESQNVLAGLQTWLASEQFREGYAPKAEKFLRERHWEQQPPPPKSRGVVSADDAVARFRARQAAKAAKEGA